MPGAGASEPRLAATVILLREAGQPLGDGVRDGVHQARDAGTQFELLLVQRNPQARFMGGAWVFPGGALSPQDGSGQPGLMAAARRELAEEAGIALPAGAELVAFTRWITPEQARTRFDTWFYLANVSADTVPEVDGQEIVDALWITPSEALARASHGSLLIAFPTVKQLQQLSVFTSVADLITESRGREIQPVRPQMLGDAILLPGDPGYV